VAPLTLDQRARIQTFPRDFIWLGTKTAKEQMIGNAVPVVLGRYVAAAVMRYSAQVAESNVVLDRAA
jgi:DNA (cytosine-5)-methyltransferase 1